MLEHTQTKKYMVVDGSKTETSMGEVCQAMDTALGRKVAIKRVHIEGDTKKNLDANKAKAESELKLMISLESEEINIPRIYDYWYDAKTHDLYIVMEWIIGQTLAKKMEAHSIESYEFLSKMRDLCTILEAMEKKNLYHKDIKPENIMITEKGTLYLIDFNISLSAANQEEGTAFYRAPEMERGSKTVLRNKVDMFAIGVIMYRFYTDHLPRKPIDYAKGSSFGSNKNRWSKFKEPKEYKPDISERVNAVITKCMKYSLGDRYRNISELKREIIFCSKEQRGFPKKNKK